MHIYLFLLNIIIMNLYVGNLSFRVTEEELTELFEAVGEVASLKVITDKFTGKIGRAHV